MCILRTPGYYSYPSKKLLCLYLGEQTKKWQKLLHQENYLVSLHVWSNLWKVGSKDKIYQKQLTWTTFTSFCSSFLSNSLSSLSNFSCREECSSSSSSSISSAYFLKELNICIFVQLALWIEIGMPKLIMQCYKRCRQKCASECIIS